jgi:hypothetical protein
VVRQAAQVLLPEIQDFPGFIRIILQQVVEKLSISSVIAVSQEKNKVNLASSGFGPSLRMRRKAVFPPERGT